MLGIILLLFSFERKYCRYLNRSNREYKILSKHGTIKIQLLRILESYLGTWRPQARLRGVLVGTGIQPSSLPPRYHNWTSTLSLKTFNFKTLPTSLRMNSIQIASSWSFHRWPSIADWYDNVHSCASILPSGNGRRRLTLRSKWTQPISRMLLHTNVTFFSGLVYLVF